MDDFLRDKPGKRLPLRLEKESFVLLEQIRTLDKGRLDDFVGRLNREQMIKVDKALRTSMEI